MSNPGLQFLLGILGVLLVVLVLVGVRRRREAIRKLILGVLVAGAFAGIASRMPQVGEGGAVLVFAFLVAVVAKTVRRRSRHIPAGVRRRVIRRWELQTGKKFNPQRYELDHEVPFSDLGSHTEDNLRVVEKRKNRKKGAKPPRWDLLGRL